ncbi:MAG: hypothetical protein KGV50_07730 [Gammaproteobacteria bacterium]|nr:hypothetical protein [Gammaproteobacteria bacterium]
MKVVSHDNLTLVAQSQETFNYINGISDKAYSDLIDTLAGYDTVYCLLFNADEENRHLAFFTGSLIDDDKAEKIISYPVEEAMA